MPLSNITQLAAIGLYDLLGRESRGHEADHLESVMAWLCRAQDATPDGGVSEGFHLWHGWLPSYPETTGYIIETFLDYGRRTGNQDLQARALRMAEWLVSIQDPDGAIKDSYFTHPMVFDTGQVLFGLTRTAQLTGEDRFIQAAERAAGWLLKVQEEDGSWIRHALYDRPHTYYSRVAWSLLTWHAVTGDASLAEAARRNIDWVLAQQQENGWFRNAGFTATGNDRPFTHTIAYTVRGVLECGLYLDDAAYTKAAERAMEGLLAVMPEDGRLAGTYGRSWDGDSGFSCLTGNAQFAIVMLRLFAHTGERRWLAAAGRLLRYLDRKQEFRRPHPGLQGAIAGSSPTWGRYIHYCYPNWAAKFYAEALMLEKDSVGS